ncbi:hypothetical protein P691DRAFT_758801 [Macrolepiota fuliginosa MF-IS2]|uniref:Uncharacterized protein n=1 Tax=Macrolepiota fuliginosa MF-IS2 TaxID=1400762 RepID=A0A9P5XE37_9AGAR|nr:hypothetical protein P691DRAFT_758801 [Macrolepiota fuliginosa MF-IS2]
MTFMWRSQVNPPSDFVYSVTPLAELVFRILICIVLCIGLVVGILILVTFRRRLGNRADASWGQDIEASVHHPSPPPLPIPEYPSPPRRPTPLPVFEIPYQDIPWRTQRMERAPPPRPRYPVYDRAQRAPTAPPQRSWYRSASPTSPLPPHIGPMRDFSRASSPSSPLSRRTSSVQLEEALAPSPRSPVYPTEDVTPSAPGAWKSSRDLDPWYEEGAPPDHPSPWITSISSSVQEPKTGHETQHHNQPDDTDVFIALGRPSNIIYDATGMGMGSRQIDPSDTALALYHDFPSSVLQSPSLTPQSRLLPSPPPPLPQIASTQIYRRQDYHFPQEEASVMRVLPSEGSIILEDRSILHPPPMQHDASEEGNPSAPPLWHADIEPATGSTNSGTAGDVGFPEVFPPLATMQLDLEDS